MYKAVALFDLDLTLLNDEKQIPPENVAALHQLRENNVLPMLSTGRNLWELKDLFAVGGLDSAIAGNGSDILFGGEHIYQSPIGRPQITRFFNETANEGIPIAFYNREHVALSKVNDMVTEHYHNFAHQSVPQVDPHLYEHEAINMMLIFLQDTPAQNKRVAWYKRQFPEFGIYRNANLELDVINKGISKGAGLKYLKHLPELHNIPTYAFGDGNNDVEILQEATVGVAMGNALPNVKKVADYVTDDYQHAGIPKALKHFDLI